MGRRIFWDFLLYGGISPLKSFSGIGKNSELLARCLEMQQNEAHETPHPKSFVRIALTRCCLELPEW